MAKQLIIMRHAKSDWNIDFGSDYNRPLANRGLRAAGQVGRLLRLLDQIPDHIITSSAERARQTVEIAVKEGQWPCPVEQKEALYEASVEDVLAQIHSIPDDAQSCLVAGHEPTCSYLLHYLIGPSQIRFPTAAMAAIKLELASWTSIPQGAGQLLWFLPPRLYADVDLQAL